MFRGLYYGSYASPREALWCIGVIILLLMIATAFIGYVLPWGQMSFWGATVITSLASAIPIVGDQIVTWLWGGFSVKVAASMCDHIIVNSSLCVDIPHCAFLIFTGTRTKFGQLYENIKSGQYAEVPAISQRVYDEYLPCAGQRWSPPSVWAKVFAACPWHCFAGYAVEALIQIGSRSDHPS